MKVSPRSDDEILNWTRTQEVNNLTRTKYNEHMSQDCNFVSIKDSCCCMISPTTKKGWNYV